MTSASLAARPVFRHATACAAALLFCSGSALAEVSDEGGGSYTTAPMYRALTYASIGNGTDGVEEGLDYVSNIAPQVNARSSGRLDLDGATAFYNASAQYSGFFASRNYATMTVNNARADQTYYLVAGQGTTTTIEFGSAEAAAKRAVFRWNVTGGNNSPSAGTASARVDFYATTEEGKNWLGLFDGTIGGLLNPNQPLFEYGAGRYEYTLPDAQIGTPIYLHFWSSAYVELFPGMVEEGSSFTLTANYASTFVLEGVDLYDANDALLTDWVMTDSTTGADLFNAAGRLAPITPSAPIPEPGTWALALLGLAGLGWRGRRRAAR